MTSNIAHPTKKKSQHRFIQIQEKSFVQNIKSHLTPDDM